MALGQARSGFDKDLREALLQEGSVGEVLGLGRPLVEIKSDHKTFMTQNFFVEYEQPSGRSGLAVTEADWWAFNTLEELEVITLVSEPRLRRLAARAWKEGRLANGGDFNLYKGILVPTRWLYEVDKAA